jgi:hypothetical protein
MRVVLALSKEVATAYAASVAGSIGSIIEGSSFSGFGERTKAAIAEQREIQRIAENAPRWPELNTRSGRDVQPSSTRPETCACRINFCCVQDVSE